MNELFLIAHKVRGEPAFDVAIQMKMPDGIWWIIPTSGHRAYPVCDWPLKDLCYNSGVYDDPSVDFPIYEIKDLDFSQVRDHYAVSGATARKAPLSLTDLIGL